MCMNMFTGLPNTVFKLKAHSCFPVLYTVMQMEVDKSDLAWILTFELNLIVQIFVLYFFCILFYT